MSDEKNVELGVFEALNALAEEKNASAETRETLRRMFARAPSLRLLPLSVAARDVRRRRRLPSFP